MRRVFLTSTFQRAALFAMLGVSILLFFLFSIATLNYDDFMYSVAPTIWAQHGSLYTDVPFVQAPLSILLIKSLIKLSGTVNIFLLARLASILLVLAAVLLPIWGSAKNGTFITWTLYVALCLTNPFVNSASQEIGNYALPLLCLSVSIVIVNMRGSATMRGFFACAAIAVAASAKLYFVILFPGILVLFLLYEKNIRSLSVITACLAGFALGCIPIWYFMFRDYQSFLLWNVYIHTLFLKARAADVTTVLSRVGFFAFVMFIPAMCLVAAEMEEYRRSGNARKILGRQVLVALACLMAISPVVVFNQYLAPAAFLLFLFSMPRPFFGRGIRARYVFLSVALLVFQSFTTIWLTYYFFQDGEPDVLRVLRIQARANEIVGSQYKCERKFYSAEPLFLLENRVKYPRELASGPFLLFLGRSANLSRFGNEFDVTTSITRWNPDIVIWGYFLGSKDPGQDEVDRAVRDYAMSREFKVQQIGYIDGKTIYLAYKASCKA